MSIVRKEELFCDLCEKKYVPEKEGWDIDTAFYHHWIKVKVKYEDVEDFEVESQYRHICDDCVYKIRQEVNSEAKKIVLNFM